MDDVTVVTIVTWKKSKPSPLASQVTSGPSMDQSVIPCFLVDSQNFLESPTGKKPTSSRNSSVDAFSQNMKPTLDDSDGQGVVRWFLLFGAIFIFFVETDSLGLGQSSIEFLAIVRML